MKNVWVLNCYDPHENERFVYGVYSSRQKVDSAREKAIEFDGQDENNLLGFSYTIICCQLDDED